MSSCCSSTTNKSLATLGLSLTRYKTGIFNLSIYQADGITAQPIVGGVLYFNAANPDLGFTSTKTSLSPPASGIMITNTNGGLNCATLTINPADTTGIPNGTVYILNAELTLVMGGNTFELAQGTLTVYPNVGTP